MPALNRRIEQAAANRGQLSRRPSFGCGYAALRGRQFACQVSALLLLSLPVLAAIDGTVTNRTTGKPQSGATVTLYKLGEAGLDSIETVKSDAEGHFTIKADLQGPRLLQSAYDGVTYNQMLPPGAPTTAVKLSVYNASKQPGEAKVTQHMVLLEPSGTELAVSESYVWENGGKTSFYDPKDAIRIYVPAAAVKSLVINCTAPQGMPIRRAPEKTAMPDVYSVDFPIKPGESAINLTYSMPFTTGPFEGKTFYKGGPTSLIAPPGVAVKGEGLEPRGIEPRTQSSIFQVKGTAYKVEISGAGTLQRPQAGESDQGSERERVSQILPKVYGKMYWILALSLGILALGFVLLLRAQGPEPAVADAKPVSSKRKR